MAFFILVINICYITILLFYSFYLDLKFRKIPNSLLKSSFLFCLILNFFEFTFCFEDLIRFIIMKSFFLIIIFFLTLLLYFLHIIGGSDGKVFMLIFFVHPVKFLNFYSITSFFLLFSLLYILL
ncbi:MAG: prepilin peptidase, partial [Promethearchaeota archaeon]